jgi:hypothetical protein
MSDGMTPGSEHRLCERGRGTGIDVRRVDVDVRIVRASSNGGNPGVDQWRGGAAGLQASVDFATNYYVPLIYIFRPAQNA